MSLNKKSGLNPDFYLIDYNYIILYNKRRGFDYETN